MINKINKGIQLIINPRKYIREASELKVKEFQKTLYKSDFAVPINETMPQDIFIAGFPKSGNTWMQSLISGILYGIDTQYLPYRLALEIVPDVHARLFYKRFGEVTFFKTHHLPRPEYKRVIYLVRDGRDALVSYYAMHKNLGVDVTLEEMVKNGKHLFPSKWHQHVKAWHQNPYSADVITVTYENLINSPITELQKICKFAGIERSEEILKKVIEGNSFENMNKKASRFKDLDHIDWVGGKGQQFFRAGKIGSYKNEMSLELQKYFEDESSNELQVLGYM